MARKLLILASREPIPDRLLAYDDSVEARYSSLGHSVTPEILESGRLVVMQYRDRRFLDVTEAFRADPDRFRADPTEEEFQYLESTELELEVVPSQIQVGAGSFTVSIPGAPSEVEIQYRIDGGPIALFPVSLNPAGNTQFFVGPQTVKGLYTFIAFRARGTHGKSRYLKLLIPSAGMRSKELRFRR